jgi:hypothetical protein
MLTYNCVAALLQSMLQRNQRISCTALLAHLSVQTALMGLLWVKG